MRSYAAVPTSQRLSKIVAMSNRLPADRCWCGVPTDHFHAGHDLATAEGKGLLDAWSREEDEEWDDWELARHIRSIEMSAVSQALCKDHQQLAATCAKCTLGANPMSQDPMPEAVKNLIDIWKDNPEAISDALALNPSLARRLREVLQMAGSE